MVWRESFNNRIAIPQEVRDARGAKTIMEEIEVVGIVSTTMVLVWKRIKAGVETIAKTDTRTDWIIMGTSTSTIWEKTIETIAILTKVGIDLTVVIRATWECNVGTMIAFLLRDGKCTSKLRLNYKNSLIAYRELLKRKYNKGVKVLIMTLNKSNPNPNLMIGLSIRLAWSKGKIMFVVKEKMRLPTITRKKYRKIMVVSVVMK